MRYCYLFRRATQNMSASRSSPTIGMSLLVLPLSPVTVSQPVVVLVSVQGCAKWGPTFSIYALWGGPHF